jgi:hypothetical protein
VTRVFVRIGIIILTFTAVQAQEVRVTPTSVNAYSQGATTVFLSFTNVVNKRPADACWCGELIDADPDIGFKCNPATLFGCLPVRYDQSSLSPNGSYTDIMSIPSSVARRAYIDAAGGAEATFFYVRRFVSTTVGPDEFVPVTIRLAGNGAAIPFSLTDVKLSWGVDKPVLVIKPGEKLPPIKAEIAFTGSGRLKGRWEIVKPGEELPSSRDLLSESTLAVDERGFQRRYTQLSTFNLFLPPVGVHVLPGPESWRVPSHIEGLYVVLLRIEAVDDAQDSSRLGAIEGRQEQIATGGVAGFSLPVLRYYVGGGTGLPAADAENRPSLLGPAPNATVASDTIIDFRWSILAGALFYRLDIQDSKDKPILSAMVPAGVGTYRAPPWLRDRTLDGNLRWRVSAFDRIGKHVGETDWRSLRVAK